MDIKISAIAILVASAIPASSSALAQECSPQDDCIIVIGERFQWGFGMWRIDSFGLGGGASGGGTAEFRMESATLEDIGDNYIPVVVPQGHRIDLDDDGAPDVEFVPNFTVWGQDIDGDGAADLWEGMLVDGRAWPY